MLEFDRTEKHLISQGSLTNPTQTSLKKEEHFLYVKYNFHQVIAALLGICYLKTLVSIFAVTNNLKF